MVLAKPERMVKHNYPNTALLNALQNTTFPDAKIPEHEFLQFRRLQSLIYTLRLAGYDVEAMQTEAFIGALLFAKVNCKLAVTRCEYDLEINDIVIQRIAKKFPDDLVWFTTNANVDHPRIRAFPIGITDYCGYSPYHTVIGDTHLFKTLIETIPRSEASLVLLNFNDKTNPRARASIRDLFRGGGFVTEVAYAADEAGYRSYIQGLRSHAFCLAPAGNGIDTHRIWESLYAGCIPVVKRTKALREFTDLPICFVDRWLDACDESRLLKFRDSVYGRAWDLRKLTVSYWYQIVCEHLGTAF